MPHSVTPFGEEHAGYLRDESRRIGNADSISFPRNEEEVREIMKMASESGLSVTVQGARTGIAGGAVPAGGHVMNMDRLNRVVGLRHDAKTPSFFLQVQPGCLLSDVLDALDNLDFETEGWTAESLDALEALGPSDPQWFAPDPTEVSASIGGMVACNASGARSYSFGPTGQHVSALRIVLVDGDTLTLRRGDQKARGRHFSVQTDAGNRIEGELPAYALPSVKNVVGYASNPDIDLVDLFIGTEGTLGIITEIDLMLLPRPRMVWGLMAFMPDENAAIKLVRALRCESVAGLEATLSTKPLCIEFFNHDTLHLLRNAKSEGGAFAELPDMPPEYHTALYVEYAGEDEEEVAEALMAASEAMVELGGDEDATWLADTPTEMKRLKTFRHSVPEAVNLLIDERRKIEPNISKLGTDMAVPDDKLEQVMDMYNRGLANLGLQSCIFGHIANNHVHVNILPRTLNEFEKGKTLYLQWAEQVVEMGGTVAAEHGIGKAKKPFLQMMLGEEGVGEMRRVKQLFDPDNLLNPEALFDLKKQEGPTAS